MPEFRCVSCGGNHSITNKSAREHCLRLMDRLEESCRLDFGNTDSKADPKLSTAPLFGKARGQMFGILVCSPEPCSSEKIILRAFSGQFNGIWEIEGWAPPLLDPAVFEAAVKKADPPIKRLTAEINSLSPGIDDQRRNDLIERRRLLSQNHMREIHKMYTIRNFQGASKSLFELFGSGEDNEARIPAGTGDCCAPKLLNQAVQLGLKPLSLAEFFWGRENRSGTKQHRCFYPPCEDKCRPILGYMLCGADYED